jgi:hypothetical protein
VHVEVVAAGETFRITEIGLFPGPHMAEWKGLMATAQAQLGPVSLGIGFLGSPAWAIGGAAAMGFIEAALTSASQKEGIRTLQRAATVLAAIHRSRRMVPVSDIAGIAFADPGSWSAEVHAERKFDVRNMMRSDRRDFLAKHGITEANVHDGIAHVGGLVKHVTLGEDFVAVTAEGRGLMQIRWSSVASYRVAE